MTDRTTPCDGGDSASSERGGAYRNLHKGFCLVGQVLSIIQHLKVHDADFT